MEGTWRGRSTRVVRTACLGFALLLALPLLLPPAGLAAGHAEELGEDVVHSEDFILGFGGARGTGVRVGPTRSGFNFTTDFAVSLADYQNTVARGDSRGVWLGMILETVVEAAGVEDYVVPQNLRIDSRDEGAEDGVTQEVLGVAEGPFAGAIGSEYGRATEEPFAEIETQMVMLGLDPVISIEGAISHATAGVVEEDVREARGEATVARLSLGGDAIVLEGLEWVALHRSGADEVVDASFKIGGLSIMGEEVLGEEEGERAAEVLATVLDAANDVTSNLGLVLETPEKVVDEETGEVAMTPLKVAVGPSEISRAIAGPLGDAIQPVREPLADALIEANELFGAVFLLYDIVFGALAGGGEILVEVGGARAVTGFSEFDNPFGDFGGTSGMGEGLGELPDDDATPEQPRVSEQPATETSTGLDAPAPDTGGSSEAPAPQISDEPAEEPVDEPVTSDPPQQQEQEMAAPAASPGPTGGQALIAALVALLVAAGLGGADFLRLRQSQRTIPT